MTRQFIESYGYSFYVEESPLYDETNGEMCIEFLSLKKQPYPCVRIIVSKNPKEPIAELQALNYYASCSIKEKMLENHEGTIVMVKTALAYMLSQFPHVTQVELQDETFIDLPTKPFITSRRLLLGQQGWYEEHLGAHPSAKTAKTLDYLRQHMTQVKLRAILETFEDAPHDNKRWWSAQNLKCVTDKFNPALFQRLLGTTWTISKETIQNWNVFFEIKLHGGGTGGTSGTGGMNDIEIQSRRLKNIIRKARIGYVNGHQV